MKLADIGTEGATSNFLQFGSAISCLSSLTFYFLRYKESNKIFLISVILYKV